MVLNKVTSKLDKVLGIAKDQYLLQFLLYYLTSKCWHNDPDMRPTFTEICDLLESEDFVDGVDSKFF